MVKYGIDIGNNCSSDSGAVGIRFEDDLNKDISPYNKKETDNAIVKGLTGSKLIEAPIPVNNSETLKLQRVLNRLKFRDSNGNILIEDGIYGSKTKSAVIRLQKIFLLQTDGTAGTATWNVINTIIGKPLHGIRYQNIIGTKYIQWRIGINIDGIFGKITRAAVIKYQLDNNLSGDGIVGSKTWDKLIG